MSYGPPIRSAAHVFYVSLRSQADTKLLKVNPTLAAGDFKVSIDGGASANLATLPTVTPAAGCTVKISLSADEMDGDNIAIVASDAAGAEWCDEFWSLQTESEGVIVQGLLIGLGSSLRSELNALKKTVEAEFGRIRPVVFDLKQSLVRGVKK